MTGVRCAGARAYRTHNIARRNVQDQGARARDAEIAMLRERARIARELHDTVSQTLYAMILSASRARRQIEQTGPAEVRASLDDLLMLANSGQSELRTLLTNIRSERVAGGLRGALASLASDARTRYGLDVRLSLAYEPDVPETTKQALVSISREAFHNIIRHAGADHVHVVLEADAEVLVLMISDDGRGFSPARGNPGHFGLQTMRERAEAAGGAVELFTAEGAGTRIRIVFPHSPSR